MRLRAPVEPRITRGLRFRLTGAYALCFTLLLGLVGLLFRQTLAANLDNQIRDVLDQEWAAVRGYLRIENGLPIWFYDPIDPDETYMVTRLKRVYLLTDSEGRVLQSSELYRNLGIDPPEQVRNFLRTSGPAWRVRRDKQGVPFLIRSGVVYDEQHRTPYYVAIGRSLVDNRRVLDKFTLTYLALVPFLILASSILGWFLAGRALEPVLAVARTAQRISGSNLSLRIPKREADDELDYLIETFNRMIERLESSFQQIRQFSTDASHELRTPLTALRGQLEVALLTARSVEEHREAILDSLQDIERLTRIVRALLELSQAESGQLSLRKSAVDLSEVAREVVERYAVLAEEAGVELQSQLEPGCLAMADPVQIERLFSNLVSNALKFTRRGGHVRVATRRVGEKLQIIFEDTGRGIPPEHLPHIFERFYRVSSEDGLPQERGLGLGLSFVAWIVKTHDGTVDVTSKPGEGTRFCVQFPAMPAPLPDESSSGVRAMKEV